MIQLEIHIADTFNNRQSLTRAFGLLTELVDQAALAGSGPELCSPEGAELLSIFLREFQRSDEQMAELLKRVGVSLS